MNQSEYLLALHRRCTITAPRFKKLSAFFADDWQKAYQAKLPDWQQAGLDNAALEKFFGTPESFSPAQELDLLQACGGQVLTLNNEAYPHCWRNIAQPPAVLFCRGNVENLNTKCMSVVGSRKMSEYGTRALRRVLEPVFKQGITVVSGLAFGVDAAAHALALEAGAPTVAVLGNGIDYFYPRNNDKLGQQILESGGTIISEHLPGVEARAENFPKRNRLVAGLGQATVVIEAALKSGSLITAGLANDFGRDVWAVPGDIFRASSAGCNQLIARGQAAPLLHHEQLLETLNLKNSTTLQNVDLSNEERELIKVLAAKNTWELDLFLAEFKQPASELNSILTLLELKGVVVRSGNQIYLS